MGSSFVLHGRSLRACCAAAVFLAGGQAIAAADSNVDAGRKLALEQCQACHFYAGTDQAGTIAPPLQNIKKRFPDRKKLYAILFDPITALDPYTMMPPFGRNKLLSDREINLVIDFLYTL